MSVSPRTRGALGAGVVALLAALSSALAMPVSVAAAQTGSTAALPGASKETDTKSLLASARLRALPAPKRDAWLAYVERSKAAQAADQALLHGELQSIGATRMTRAAFRAASFSFDARSKATWLDSDSARAMITAMLTYQTPSGGWSKHIDFMQGPRAPGQSFFSENEQWQYIATIDNDATTSELRFLMRAIAARGNAAQSERMQASVVRGVQYLLNAQFPNGCWPQVWPLQGGYHDNATFNDDAIAEVLGILDEIARGEAAFVPDSLRQRAGAAVAAGARCILEAQVRVDGTLTVWGQQHDPLTLAPTSARSYELTSLTSKESAGVMDFLMAHDTLDARIPTALAGAVAWLDGTAIAGMRSAGKNGLVPDASAGQLWARMYEIGTNRPIFSNRDGIKLYGFNALTDRREGYGWYSDLPAAAIKRYRQWLAARGKAPSTSKQR